MWRAQQLNATHNFVIVEEPTISASAPPTNHLFLDTIDFLPVSSNSLCLL